MISFLVNHKFSMRCRRNISWYEDRNERSFNRLKFIHATLLSIMNRPLGALNSSAWQQTMKNKRTSFQVLLFRRTVAKTKKGFGPRKTIEFSALNYNTQSTSLSFDFLFPLKSDLSERTDQFLKWFSFPFSIFFWII